MSPTSQIADVVVVGAGAAGCALAAQLATRTSGNVALIEAGAARKEAPDDRVPGLALARLAQPHLSWGDVTAPQPGLGGRSLPLAQAKGLGGGSQLNFMVWLQGHPDDYAAWMRLGAEGWDWRAMAAAFTAIEDRRDGNAGSPGMTGPMTVSQPSDLHPISAAFVSAAHEAGVPISADLNSGTHEGAGLSPANIRDGRRWSVVEGYLHALRSGAVSVVTGAHVTRVLFDASHACGVEYLTDGGATHVVEARDGVVLCAGAIRTPQLLMLSGIGDSSQLAGLGITTRHHLPGVGQRLSDHPIIYPTWRTRDDAGLLTFAGDAELQTHRLLGRGPLASLAQVVAMVRSQRQLNAPDLQMFLVRAGLDDDLAPLAEPAVSCGIALLTPVSRGEVRLASSDPMQAPVIDPGFLTDPRDLAVLRRGLTFARELFASARLAALTQGAISPSQAELSTAELDAWIRGHVFSEWHPTGTARMGTDATAVVDPTTMQVRGPKDLYVADASVMPTLPRANTQAPTIAIAERAAELILRHRSHAGEHSHR